MKRWLLDTGALVAGLDSSDPAHGATKEKLISFSGLLTTNGAVLTEAFYLLRRARNGPERLIEFIEAAGVIVVDVFDGDQLQQIVQLMRKYANIPMDFADASLVHMAETSGCADILTLDERGFRSYRFRGNRKFRLVLQDT